MNDHEEHYKRWTLLAMTASAVLAVALLVLSAFK